MTAPGSSSEEQQTSAHAIPVASGWSAEDRPAQKESTDSEVALAAAEQSALEDDELLVDYRRFRRAGVMAGLTVTTLRLGAFFGLAAYQNARIVIDYFVDIIPYPVVQVARAQFAEMVSRSTLYMAAIMLALFMVIAFRHTRRNQTVWGWFMGIVACATTLTTDVLRDIFDPPVVVYSTVLWTLWPIGLAIVIFLFLGKSRDATTQGTGKRLSRTGETLTDH